MCLLSATLQSFLTDFDQPLLRWLAVSTEGDV